MHILFLEISYLKGLRRPHGYREGILSPSILSRLETTTFVVLELTIREIALDSKHLPSGMLYLLIVIYNDLGILKVRVWYIPNFSHLFIYLFTSIRKNERITLILSTAFQTLHLSLFFFFFFSWVEFYPQARFPTVGIL